MRSFRVLNIDDDSDIREVVAISLGLNPEFEVHWLRFGQRRARGRREISSRYHPA